MYKDIILQRELDLECWHVLGQVAKGEKRMELMPVLMRVKQQGKTDARDIAEHLFFESEARRVVASRVLYIAQTLGLLEEQDKYFVLTADGETAIDTEQVFVPEDGVWTVWASNDPLLDGAILRVDVWREPSSIEENRKKGKDAEKKRPMKYLPHWLRGSVGLVTTPAANADGGAIRVDGFQDKGESIAYESTLKLRWNVSASTLQLVGSLNGRDVNTALPAPNLSVADVWQQLLEGEELWSQWDQSYEALRVDFESTDPSTREAMTCDLDFAKPQIRGFGDFVLCTVASVARRADTALDAQLWAQWRLQERIRDYATAQRFAQWQQEAAQPFTDEFQPRLPQRDEMANKAWHERGALPAPSVWHLVAAKDWGM